MSASAASLSPSETPDTFVRRRPLAGWAGAVVLAVVFAIGLVFFPPVLDASKALDTPVWAKFFGRFHVIMLHIPVGVIALAALMELIAALGMRSAEYLRPATTFALNFGSWGAVVAVLFGVMLARKGGFDTAEFYAHQAFGIATAVLFIVTLALKLVVDQTGRMMALYRSSFVLALVVMALGAHFGGNMVHGSDYLIKYAPESVARAVTASEEAVLARFQPVHEGQPTPPLQPALTTTPVEGATVYAALIAPLLDAKCNACHNADKSKGDLRLDTHEFILKGGGNGETVIPGQPEKSRLVTSMELPLDDDDHMPPEKKPQPSKEEIALLSWWVKEGASKDLTVAEAKFPEALKATISTMMANSKGGSGGGTPPLMLALAEAAAQVDPAVAEAMKKINGSGASLAPVAADAKQLRFTALNVAKDYADASLKDLEPIAANIVALDLAKTKVTDAACDRIAKMVNLKELHLENTAVTDAGVEKLKGLANLEYLNLYGTKVTDKVFAQVESMGKLKALYLWQSGVTRPAADAFKAKHPGMTVNTGWTEADNAKVVAAAPVAPAPAPTTAAPAAAPAPAAAAVKPADVKPSTGGTALPKATDPNAKVFADVVAPILEAKCTSCHGAEKSKGKLRLHTFADVLKGGSDGATTAIAGDTKGSLLLVRAKLPLDDDDHMPPSDEPQLTKEELALLEWWIAEGAKEDLTVGAAKKTPELEGMLKALASAKGGASATAKKAEKPKAKPLTDAEKKTVAEVTAKVTALNATLMPLALDTEQLRFGCVNAADKFGDKELALLAPAAPHLAWVDLARSKVTDAGLTTIAQMANVERLHLENTAVTDAGLAHLSGLAKLEYLNLYGTKVTDAGIAKLAANKALRKLFLWQTAVTKDGAKKLEAAVPGLVVNVGLSEAEIAKLIEAAKPPPAPAPPAPAPKKDEKKPEPPKPATPAPAAKPEAKPAAPATPTPAAKPEVKPAPPAPAAKPAASTAPAEAKKN